MTVSGTVYLLHFDRPYKHARHYIGWTSGELTQRLRQHRNGTGARLLQVIAAEGIGFAVARLWDGGRNLERSLKNRGGASRACPLCGVRPRVTGWEPMMPADLPMPHASTFMDATCACNRIITVAANLLTTATFTCRDCGQPVVPLTQNGQGDHHAATV
ncbi:unnamed protein product [[Actinomadura] parvosata subsp. kistnae]|uniref:GIY-YIG domain-containing protein n=1 Tax=[Actinomadura] parvosata subsp. kistnae TaxID=1909395 RepID=A0A1V0A5R0_9ACTN|nr:hypothetical protein [Nonomuraea sp. ATCC 55076]AQZ65546.1 hypothetical protein BKM31_32450 [Nonomuraea sp. ATCC 55076]SPL96907.1 unnamed protein product [Actinomadura parvosata subsp. kistnae]